MRRTGLVAPRHVGSSQTRARTCVPCVGRQILNHYATREAPSLNSNQVSALKYPPSTSLCRSSSEMLLGLVCLTMMRTTGLKDRFGDHSKEPVSHSTGSRRAGSVIVAHGPSCSAACGIFPDQGSNPCPLHWQADSQPLRHQESPSNSLLYPFTPVLGPNQGINK
ncbi:hypothetical protein J1605_011137 [Eschrichtius robustus]|uniref:Uncharacterized protein n=1 Tax=Eschrichtius robustus TaxID=9764 RepID=A0AB34GPI6_ESCRO|nr:hypothetical protein J1605_011137 [Eschrichtius robustus]